MTHNDMIVTLTVGELKQMVRDEVKAAMQVVLDAVSGKEQESEVHGLRPASATLGCSMSQITDMLKTGILGSALWKPARNGKITLDTKRGKARFGYLMTQPMEVQQAWRRMGASNAEAEWKRLGM